MSWVPRVLRCCEATFTSSGCCQMKNNIQSVLKHIAKREGNISKAQVAKLLGWRASYFHRGFKKKAGVSFRTKRFQIKMEIAGSLLTSTSMTVERIATSLGYSERGNFERAFKRVYGVTPTQFRIQQWQQESTENRRLKT